MVDPMQENKTLRWEHKHFFAPIFMIFILYVPDDLLTLRILWDQKFNLATFETKCLHVVL